MITQLPTTSSSPTSSDFMFPPGATVVKQGFWLYDKMIPREVRIVRHNVMYGSHDQEDPPEVREDRNVECYYLNFQAAASSDQWAGGGACLSLEDAIRVAEAKLGSTLTWLPGDIPEV